MSEDTHRLDRIVDEALQDLTAGEPREGFRGRVMARIAAPPEPSPVRIIDIFGWRVRPLQLATAGAALAVLVVAVVLAPGLWPPRDLPSSPGGRIARGEAAGGPGSALGTRTGAAEPGAAPVRAMQAAELVGSTGGQAQSARLARRRSGNELPADAGGSAESASPIPPVVIAALVPPEDISIVPIEVQPVAIRDITIQEIQIPPIEGGKVKR